MYLLPLLYDPEIGMVTRNRVISGPYEAVSGRHMHFFLFDSLYALLTGRLLCLAWGRFDKM